MSKYGIQMNNSPSDEHTTRTHLHTKTTNMTSSLFSFWGRIKKTNINNNNNQIINEHEYRKKNDLNSLKCIRMY